MISIAMLSGGKQAADYYLDRGADCGAEYYSDSRVDAGSWSGAGAAALGLTGLVEGQDREVFAHLLAGTLPDGTRVGRAVLRPDDRAQLLARPLVDTIHAHASSLEVPASKLFQGPREQEKFTALAVRLEASRNKSAVRVDAETAGQLIRAAGQDPVEVYRTKAGTDLYTSALPYVDRKVDHRRAGLDVTVSPPKSVSVLTAFVDEGLREQIVFAHQAAVTEALDYLQRHTAHGLRGHQGHGQRAERIASKGFIAAAFTHHTSRADDPQLHTHLVIINAVQGVDGRWSSVDSRAIFKHARTAGAVYQAALRGELTRRLGVEWGPIHKSVAEVAGIPEDVIRQFSTQRLRIEEASEQSGSDSRRARQRAAYRTRPDKSHAEPAALHGVWEQRLADVGWDAESLVHAATGRALPPPMPDLEELAQRLFGPAGLTAMQTTFVRRELTRELVDALPAGTSVSTAAIESLTDQLLAHRDVIELDEPAASGERQWTTAELLATERRAFTHAARVLPATHIIDADAVAELVSAAKLNADQRDAVLNAVASRAAVQVLVGPAGSGKTTVLATATECWRVQQRPVLGAALAAVTAQRLEAAAGIESQSLARLLTNADRIEPGTARPRGLPQRVVIVIDEASMVGTHQLVRLLEHVHDAGGSTVLVGDPAQLPEVEAGGLFNALASRSKTTQALTGNVRQVHDWERRALVDLRAGAVDAALDQYLDHGRIHIADTPDELTKSFTSHYLRSRATHGTYGAVALASRRTDVHRLNEAVRSQLQTQGLLGPDAVVIHGTYRRRAALAVGDLVMVTQNDPAIGLMNGTRAQLTAANPRSLTLHTEDGRDVAVATEWATGRLTHAYAMTVHKSQGLTADDCLLYGTAALCQQAGYVALSRGRRANHVYTTLSSLDADREPSRFQLLQGPDPADVIDALATRLSQAHTHTLASHQRPHLDGGRRLGTSPLSDRDYGIEL